MRILLAFLLAFNGYFPAFSQTSGGVISASNIEGLDVEKNYILNGGGEKNTKGWSEFDDGAVARPIDGTGSTAANLTFAVTSTNPLEDRGSFLLSKAAADAQGEGVSYDFKIPRAKRGERQCIFFDYEIDSGTFTAGTDTTDSDLIAYIYDKDAGQLIEPENFKLFSIGKDKFGGCFSPVNIASDDYRLILHVANANANAWTMKIDNVKVGVRNTPRGPPVSDCISYTPTITSVTGTLTNYTATGCYKQIGDEVVIRATITFTGSPGTWTGPEISLPAGLSIDFTKTAYEESGGKIYRNGKAAIHDAGTGTFAGTPIASTVIGVSKIRISMESTDTVAGAVDDPLKMISTASLSNTYPMTFVSGDIISVQEFTVPIQGWSSNTKISDGFEGRDVSLTTAKASVQNLNPNNSFVKVNIDSLASWSSDKIGMFDIPNSRIIIKTSGSYSVTGSINLAGTNVLNDLYQTVIRITRAGVDTDFAVFNATPPAGKQIVLQGSRTFDLIAGDIIQLYIRGSGNNSTNQLTAEVGSLTGISISKLQSGQTITGSPIVALHAAGTAGDTIGTGNSLIKFTTVETNTHGTAAYSSSTGLFTAPESGYYRASWLITTAGVTLSTSQRLISFIALDGTQYRNGGRAVGNGVSNPYNSGGSIDSIYLRAGQTLSIYATSNVATTAATGTADCFFTVTKAGN